MSLLNCYCFPCYPASMLSSILSYSHIIMLHLTKREFRGRTRK